MNSPFWLWIPVIQYSSHPLGRQVRLLKVHMELLYQFDLARNGDTPANVDSSILLDFNLPTSLDCSSKLHVKDTHNCLDSLYWKSIYERKCSQQIAWRPSLPALIYIQMYQTEEVSLHTLELGPSLSSTIVGML